MRELRERAETILRIVALILAALVVYQLAGWILHWNPFRGVTVPELPTLAAGTNAPGGGPGTNVVAAGGGTNHIQKLAGTNPTPSTATSAAATNAALAATTNSAAPAANAGTNVVARQETRLSETNSATPTNPADTSSASAAAANPATNSFAQSGPVSTNTNTGTNLIARSETNMSGTNSTPATNAAANGTNALRSARATGTNAAPADRKEPINAQTAQRLAMAGMNFNPFGPPGQGNIELPPAVKSRISKIVESEILGPVMHPMPMALMGIAGNVAFLRSAHGQTGLVKPGDSLDDMKLLRIGVNRVLIEQAGEKKELTIFDGYGGDCLLPNNSTNENTHP